MNITNSLITIGRRNNYLANQHQNAISESKTVDSMNEAKRKSLHFIPAVSAQVCRDRVSIHDLAQKNPVLRNIMRQLQK